MSIPTVDHTASGEDSGNNNITTLDLTFTINAANSVLVVGAVIQDPDKTETVSSVTWRYGASPQSLNFEVGVTQDTGAARIRTEFWVLENPSTGTSQTIRIVTTGGCGNIIGMAYQINGADTTDSTGANDTAVGANSTAASISVTTGQDNSLVVSFVGSSGLRTHAPDDETEREDLQSIGPGINDASACAVDEEKASAGATPIDVTVSSVTNWAMVGVEIKEAIAAVDAYVPVSRVKRNYQHLIVR